MKATDFQVGTHVIADWYGNNRYKVVHKGQGHGNVHKLRQVDQETGADLPNADEMRVSSRNIRQTWDQFIAQHPNFIANEKAKKQEAESRKTLMDEIKNVCEETAGLLNALGFEAKVTDAGYRYGTDAPYVIVIMNPTENQEYLRKQVAEKWGI